MEYDKRVLKGFAEAAQSLKLYRRAELADQKDRPLIEQLYVDPLQNNAVLEAVLRTNTTFIIGRKGTGKSTVFQRAQHEIRKRKRAVSAYVDIKTVFESANVDPTLLAKAASETAALDQTQIKRLLLFKSFMRCVLSEIKTEIRKQIEASFIGKVREKVGRGPSQVFEQLDELIDTSLGIQATDVTGLQNFAQKEKLNSKASSGTKLNLGTKAAASAAGANAEFNGGYNREFANNSEQENENLFSRVLMTSLNITSVIEELQSILNLIEVKHLYLFIDDFSELPEDAMHVFVDTILSPLNNWSNELIKFKVAAYPGRIYYGKIDPLKMDEIYLDLFKLYGANDVPTMEDKGIDFTSRLLENRIRHFCRISFEELCRSGSAEVVRSLFFASMGNPRTLGHILNNLQESHIAYSKALNTRAVRDASVKYYDEKIEPFFGIQKFRQETFSERSSAFSLKELLEDIVSRARDLRSYRGSTVTREIQGQPPTSHFHVVSDLDDLLSTLELNFFLTKYFEMKDRDGRKVSVYALNFGLCNKYSIEFGRPAGRREFRLYFVERFFDFTPILKRYLEHNQEIKCDSCGELYGVDKIPSLTLFDMLCPKCKRGKCKITNLSKRYGEVLESIRPELLLPEIELGMLETLHAENRDLFAREIAEELDCSYQLIGRRGKIMEERGLIDRIRVENYRRVYRIKPDAVRDYFEKNPDRHLNVSENN